MLRSVLGVMRMARIRNEYVRGPAQVEPFGYRARKVRLNWFGDLRRRDAGYVGRTKLRIDLSGKRKRGRPKMRFLWCDGRCRGQEVEMETDYLLWRCLTGAAESLRGFVPCLCSYV